MNKILELLKIARCPDVECTDGTIASWAYRNGSYGEPICHQCQWCDEREQILKEEEKNETN